MPNSFLSPVKHKEIKNYIQQQPQFRDTHTSRTATSREGRKVAFTTKKDQTKGVSPKLLHKPASDFQKFMEAQQYSITPNLKIATPKGILKPDSTPNIGSGL